MKISIPQPCHENWNDMLPAEKGRFCQSCQKCVLDLTKMTDREIIETLKQDDLCVKISHTQVDQINSKYNLTYPKWLRYPSLLIAFGFSSMGFAQNKSDLKYTTSDIEKLIKQDTAITLKLQLVDDFDGSPIPDAKVYLNKRKRKISTVTDENGFFELEIPTKYLNDFIIVESEYLNRKYQIRNILNQEKIGNEIYLGSINLDQNKSYSILNSFYKLLT